MKHNKSFKIAFCSAIAALGLPAAHAAAITPTYTSFGALPVATFGGSGISNANVAISTILVGQQTITLGLTATPRFSSPAISNDGAGTFQAQPGDFGAPNPGYSFWNFSFYADVPTSLSGYTTELFFDTNPAVGNDVTTSVSFPNINYAGPVFQDSWNPAFGFLNSLPLGPTNGVTFDPTANGEYGFALVVKDSDGIEVGRSAINVNVGSPVPDGGTTLALLGSSLGLLIGVRRKFRK